MNVVRCLDSFELDARRIIITYEFYRNGTLLDLMQRYDGPLPGEFFKYEIIERKLRMIRNWLFASFWDSSFLFNSRNHRRAILPSDRRRHQLFAP